MIYTAHTHTPQLPPALANPFDIDAHTHPHHCARLAHDAKTKERRTYFGHTHGVALTIHISVGHVGFSLRACANPIPLLSVKLAYPFPALLPFYRLPLPSISILKYRYLDVVDPPALLLLFVALASYRNFLLLYRLTLMPPYFTIYPPLSFFCH